MFDKLKQLAKESLIYGLNSLISGGIVIFLVPLYTRVFNPADYGVLELINVYFALLSTLIVFGLDAAQALYYYGTDDVIDRKFTLSTSIVFQFGLSTIVAMVMLMSSVNLSSLAFGKPFYGLYFRLIALDLPFAAIIFFSQNVLRLARLSWKYTFLTIIILVSNFILTVFMVVIWKKGIYGIFLSKLIIDALFTSIALYLIYPYLGITFSWFRLKQLLAYGVPLIPASIALWVLNFSNRYFLQYYSSLSDVGLYSVGSRLASIMGLITGAFRTAWGPFALSIHREENARQVYANVLTYYLVLTSGIGIGLSIFAPEIIAIFTTTAYYGASAVISYLAFGLIAYGAYYIFAIGVNITKKTSHIGWTTMLAAGVNIILNFLLIPRIGMVGAAIAALVSQWVSAGALLLVSQRYYRIPYKLSDVAVILISSALLIILGNCILLTPLWLGIPIKVVILILYAVILVVFRIIRLDMLLRLVRVI